MEKRIGYLLERTTRVAKLSFTKMFRDLGIDITPEQWVIIDTLAQNGKMSQKKLGKESFKNPPTISRIVENLVKKGFVLRHYDDIDRRVTTIALSQKGKELERKCRPYVVELRNSSWDELSENDYDDFVRILDKIFENFEKKLS